MRITKTKDGYLLAKGTERFKLDIEDAWKIVERVEADGETILKECEKYFEE